MEQSSILSICRSASLLTAVALSGVGVLQAQGVGLERAYPRLRFERPVFLTGAGDGSGRLFVVEQDGVIRVFTQDAEVASSAVFLDIRERVSRRGNEEGLIGLAFDPDFERSGLFYVHYSSSVKDQVGIVSRLRVSADDPGRADPDFEEIILEQPQPYRNHNGGMLAFGPDRMLYISFGDGGLADDPQGNGQNLGTWLGAILRIDVRSDPGAAAYVVPEDNPFVGLGDDVRPEIWAYGLRNVWRFSFDRRTRQMWAGDVGQNLLEEVVIIEAGGNYGWNAYEASRVFAKDTEIDHDEHILPVVEYGRGEGISITGGYVYRGSRYPDLRGRYIYGDYASGNLWSLAPGPDGAYRAELVRRTGRSIASFGEDDSRELYLLSFDGGLYRIVSSDEPVDSFADWSTKLSETGLFESVRGHKIAAHVVSYEVNAPFWSDAAEKMRFFVLPEGEAFGYREDGTWEVPVGTTLVKSFQAPGGGAARILETRLIERTATGWEAATYVWNQAQTDATLVPGGSQFELYQRSGVSIWHAPSASECAICHVEAAGYALGLTTAQLNRKNASGEDQLERWIERGILRVPDTFDVDSAAAHIAPQDESQDLETRARTWLEVNCAMCHYPSGPGNAAIDLRFATPLAQTGLVDGEVAQGDFGIEDARIVAPGDPGRSILWYRVHTLGDGRMPNVATNRVDEQGSNLLRAWIEGLQEK